MKHSNFVPYLFLFGGLAGALAEAWLAYLDPSVERCVGFAVACVVAAIGYAEKNATDEHNATFYESE